MVHYNSCSYNNGLRDFLEKILFEKRKFFCYVCIREDSEVKIYGKKEIIGHGNIHDICCMVAGAKMLYQEVLIIISCSAVDFNVYLLSKVQEVGKCYIFEKIRDKHIELFEPIDLSSINKIITQLKIADGLGKNYILAIHM